MVTVQDIYPESILTGHQYPAIINYAVKKLLTPIDKFYCKHATKVRTISMEMARYMAHTRGIPLEHYLVLNNWQNDEDYEDVNFVRDDGQLVFAYVGSINAHSNVQLLIKAFFKAKLSNAVFKIYGGGNQCAECKDLASALDAHNVHFSFIDRKKVPEVQANADVLVFALPKGNGGLCLPSKLTSYMLSGKPVLASIDKDSASVRYIGEAECGIAVEPDCEEALIAAFRSFSNMDKTKLSAMGENSKRFAAFNLTRKANLPKIIEEIDKHLS